MDRPHAKLPNGNVAAPINVGSIAQVKNGGLGVNTLAVFGNSLFGGSTGSNAYLNFGATAGSNGYGIRDNAGVLEFKNSGGSWASIQSTVYNLWRSVRRRQRVVGHFRQQHLQHQQRQSRHRDGESR